MRRRIQQVFGIPVVLALGLMTTAAWSQNQYDANDQRSERNNQGRQQYDEQQRSNQQSGNQYDDRSNSQRNAQSDMRDRSDERSQDSRFGDRRDSRGEYSNRSDDQSWAERRQERRADRNDEDGPAGLGVMLDTSNGAIEVREVARRSPAARAGIERGDEIVAINGRQIGSPEQLAQIVRQQEPGSQIDIRLRRDGQQRTVTAELESLSQALDTLERERFERWRDQEDSFANSPPWGDDQVMQHVDELEQQVRRMQQEINDLRSMLNSSPSDQRFSQRNQRNQSQYRD